MLRVAVLASLLLAAADAAAQFGRAARSAQQADQARAAMQAGNFAQAYCIWVELAGRGDADAQYNIGWLYHNGYGLVIDDLQASHWWLRAAEQGHVEAHFALGNLYRFGGRGVDADLPRALPYYLFAGAAGDEESRLILRTLVTQPPRQMAAQVAELIRHHGAAFGTPLRVDADQANLRGGPSTSARLLATLTRGESLLELERRGNWVQVGRIEDGSVGWMHDSLVAAGAQGP
jgi:uncharacterized protein